MSTTTGWESFDCASPSETSNTHEEIRDRVGINFPAFHYLLEGR